MAIDTKTGAAKFLGFPLRNTVWSWGGQHPDGRVFLFVWDGDGDGCDPPDVDPPYMRRVDSGRYEIPLQWPREYYERLSKNPSLGWHERSEHIAAIQAGAPGVALFCKAVDRRRQFTVDPRGVRSKIAHVAVGYLWRILAETMRDGAGGHTFGTVERIYDLPQK